MAFPQPSFFNDSVLFKNPAFAMFPPLDVLRKLTTAHHQQQTSFPRAWLPHVSLAASVAISNQLQPDH